MTSEEALELLKAARMDFTNGQGKLTDVMNAIRAGSVEFRQTPAPQVQIRMLIRNGVIKDVVDLLAEFEGQGLVSEQLWRELVAELPSRAKEAV